MPKWTLYKHSDGISSGDREFKLLIKSLYLWKIIPKVYNANMVINNGQLFPPLSLLELDHFGYLLAMEMGHKYGISGINISNGKLLTLVLLT